jgi:hypothetical protein
MSASEFESIGSARSAKRVLTARTVLAGRFGTPVELALLYASFVRALGADARLVLAVDRRQRYWNPEIKSIQQFSYFFVAVKMPGESDDKAEVVDPSSGLPYGELPWQATGAHAVVATNAGFRAIALSPTMADRNVGETQMALTFGEGGASMLSHWSFVGQGQQGRGSRSALRAVTGEDRVRRLDGLCGTESWEARRAEAPDLDERTAPFKLTCELENDLTNFDASLGSYSVSLAGPWWPEVPSFPEPARRQPVIFSFPRTDLVHVDIAAPPGFAAGDPPAPVALDTPIGSYAMSVTVREHAFHVERKLVIKGLKVDPAGYDGVRTFFADVSRADRALVTFRRAATGNP